MNFTKSEIRVLFVLLLILFLGVGIKITKGFISDDSALFDYAKSDRMFRDKSDNLLSVLSDTNIVVDSLFSKGELKTINSIKSSEDSLKNIDGKKKKKGKKGDDLKEKSININTATKEQLILLPGIGDSTADKILMYRKEHGAFKNIEDIMKIKGIGTKKFEKMKPYITTD
ncbi:MAG: helix-hairpin-helix domain-containing protein [Ignavibacteriota bacterium]|nr:helix-hairpin-helix domain-containing protein [Ignavibacteriota bacterium]